MISLSLLQMLTELNFETVFNGCNHRVSKMPAIAQPMTVAPHIGFLLDNDFSVLMDARQRTMPFFGLLDSEVCGTTHKTMSSGRRAIWRSERAASGGIAAG